MLPLADLFVHVYVLIDDAIAAKTVPIPRRPGPAETYMAAVGEDVQPGYDEIVQTDLDYPMRNVYQIGRSSGLIVVTGGDGTLEEILPALIDYNLPVGVLKGSGQAAVAIEALLDVFPAWQASVLIGDSPEGLIRFVFDRLSSQVSTEHT